MDDYITKPVRSEELVQALERAVARLPTAAASETADLAEPEIAVLEAAVLEKLQAELGEGDAAIVAELIGMFLSDTPALRDEMRQALTSGATEPLQRAAHTLKSSSATLGARALAARCAKLEHLAPKLSMAEGSELLRQIEQVYEETQRALQEFQVEAIV